MTDRTENDPQPEAVARRELAVRAAVVQGVVGPEKPLAALLDVTGIRRATRALKAAFAPLVPEGAGTAPGAGVQHTFAVRATPLVPVLRLLYEDKIGAEVASSGELALARAAGVRPGQTVLDSPAKTVPELREALGSGVLVNADNGQELDRIDALRAELPTTASLFGLRVDARARTGHRALSGVPLGETGGRAWVVEAYLRRPWLTRLHAHSGAVDAQGAPPEVLAREVREVYELAEEINTAAGRRQVDTIGIGGGLPVDLGSDAPAPDFAAYAGQLRESVPGLFDGRYAIITGFGRSLLAKQGLILSRVEYAKSTGERPLAVTHAGVQIATRAVHAPDAWPLRVLAHDPQGRPKRGEELEQDLAGPACFEEDLLAERRSLPPLDQGDWIAVLDTGAYGFAHHYASNSLARPGIHGFVASPEGVRFATVRAPQTLAEVVAESGGGHTRALTDDL